MEIVEIPKERLNDIESLWSELNSRHHELSSHFKDHFASFTFSEHRNKLLESESLTIFAAKVENNLVGYCIASG